MLRTAIPYFIGSFLWVDLVADFADGDNLR